MMHQSRSLRLLLAHHLHHDYLLHFRYFVGLPLLFVFLPLLPLPELLRYRRRILMSLPFLPTCSLTLVALLLLLQVD